MDFDPTDPAWKESIRANIVLCIVVHICHFVDSNKIVIVVMGDII
jgi:hypothetical protein